MNARTVTFGFLSSTIRVSQSIFPSLSAVLAYVNNASWKNKHGGKVRNDNISRFEFCIPRIIFVHCYSDVLFAVGQVNLHLPEGIENTMLDVFWIYSSVVTVFDAVKWGKNWRHSNHGACAMRLFTRERGPPVLISSKLIKLVWQISIITSVLRSGQSIFPTNRIDTQWHT